MLLSLALLAGAAAEKVLASGATLIVAGVAGDSLPLLGEAIDVSDPNLPSPGPLYLQSKIFRPSLLAPASTRSVSQTTGAAKEALKLYQLKGVLLI